MNLESPLKGKVVRTGFSEQGSATNNRQIQWGRFLSAIGAVATRAVLANTIASHGSSGGGRGRWPIGLKQALRRSTAQQYSGTPDEGVMIGAPNDSQAIYRFICDVANREATIGDTTTRLKISLLPETHQLIKSIIMVTNAYLAKKIMCLRENTVVGTVPITTIPLKTRYFSQNNTRLTSEEDQTHQFLLNSNLHYLLGKIYLSHRKKRYKGSAKNIACPFSLFSFTNLTWVRRQPLNAQAHNTL